jgi:hypothetical protein
MTYGDSDEQPMYAYFSAKEWTAHDLGLDDRFTVSLGDVVKPGFGEGRLALVIEYSIPIISWKRRKIYPILSRRRADGTFFWAFDTAIPRHPDN